MLSLYTLNPLSTMTIRLTKKHRKRISKAKDIYSTMRTILLRESKHDRNKEHFWVVGLQRDAVLSYIELVALGTVNSTVVNPVEVFSFAMQKKVHRVILIHNHPSGNLVPSENDLELTKALYRAGQLLNIQIVDHLIISTESYTSLFDAGFLVAEQLDAASPVETKES